MATIRAYTTIEQSRKLAEILPLESADYVIVSFGSREGTKTVVMPKETLDVFRTPFADIREILPAWSLAALLGVLPKGHSLGRRTNGKCYVCMTFIKHDVTEYDNPVDACVDMIEKLHELKKL